MAVVQVEAAEHLVGQVAQAGGKVVAAVARTAQAGQRLQLLGQAAAGQLQRRDDARALGRSQAGRGQRAVGATEQGAQSAGLGEKFAPQRDRILAGHAVAQQHRQQLGVGEGRAAVLQQLFAGTFAAGPVTYAHPVDAARRSATAGSSGP
jgi:hypothetical protein